MKKISIFIGIKDDEIARAKLSYKQVGDSVTFWGKFQNDPIAPLMGKVVRIHVLPHGKVLIVRQTGIHWLGNSLVHWDFVPIYINDYTGTGRQGIMAPWKHPEIAKILDECKAEEKRQADNCWAC